MKETPSIPPANSTPAQPAAAAPAWRQLVIYLLIAAAIGALASFLSVGFDYRFVFGPHKFPIFYVPWTDGLMYLLPWPAIVALTVLALIIGVQRHRGSPGTIVLALFSLPTIWVLLLGQLEGVALLGLLLMPWSVPVRLLERRGRFGRREWITLALFMAATVIAAVILIRDQGPLYYEVSPILGKQPQIGVALLLLLPWVVPVALLKPQLTAFAMLARKNWLITTILWVALSIVIWGFWLPNLDARLAPGIRAAQPQDVSLFPYSLLIAVPMLWLARGDAEMLMAAGALAVPTVHPYQYIVLMPALARLPLGLRLLCWLSSFLPLTANYFGPAWWLTGNIFPLLLWLCLLWQRRRQKVMIIQRGQVQSDAA
jgi:hypothetical protein